jgi:hypothetical protein
MKTKYLVILSLPIALAACSTTSKVAEEKAAARRRVVIDNTYHGPTLPEWTRDGKSSWDDGKVLYFKAEHTVRGDQRIDACFDLAKMNLKENLVTEISATIKGEINLASEGISEASETALTKSFTQQIEANITGLKHSEQLFERYLNGDTERIDCFVMSKMTHDDYSMLKTHVLQKAAKSNSELAEILRKRQAQFFSNNSSDTPVKLLPVKQPTEEKEVSVNQPTE